MAITELVVPSIQNTTEARTIFENDVVSAVKTMLDLSPGYIAHLVGPVLSENNVNLEHGLKYVLGAEWKHFDDFKNTIASAHFGEFVKFVKPVAASPVAPQIYETDFSPAKVYVSGKVVEVFRLPIGEKSLAQVQTAWDAYVDAVKKVDHGVESISGKSLNLEVETFAGFLGWESPEARSKAQETQKVKDTKAALERFEDANTIVAKF